MIVCKLDKSEVEKLYMSGMTQKEVASTLKVTEKVIERFMVRHKIPRRKAIIRKHIVGALHPLWKGNSVTYKVFHKRLYKILGQPKKCSVCGTDKAKRYDWANLTGKYHDPGDYKRMCRSCHFKHDGMHKNFK